MYFDLTDDQKSFQAAIEALLADRLPQEKAVPHFDREALDTALWAEIAAMGFGGLMVPEDAGGLGLDLLSLAAIQETLGWFAAPVPLAETVFAGWLIATAGTPEQRDRWLAPIIAGECIVAFALDEGDDAEPGGWTVTGPRLAGSKSHVAWAAHANLLIVGGVGGTLYLVEAASDAATISPVLATDKSRPLADVRLDGAAGEALADHRGLAQRVLDALAILLAADACGAGQRALRLAVDYALTRKQFDRLIGSFQALKHQLANLAAEMEPARYLVWHAAHVWSTMPDQCSYAASLAKAHLGEVAVRTARGAVEAHGGIGYTWEYPLHVFLKRAMFDRAVHGSPAFHRARAASLAEW